MSFSVSGLHKSMARSPRMIMATLLLLVRFATCSDHTTQYVKPTANTPCPAHPCLTLSEYAQQTHRYITSNTTLLFLPGDHVLSVNFTVKNVSNFEIYAQQTSTAYHTASGSRIVCQGLVGLAFAHISHMTVHGLTFNSCKMCVLIRYITTSWDVQTLALSITWFGYILSMLPKYRS